MRRAELTAGSPRANPGPDPHVSVRVSQVSLLEGQRAAEIHPLRSDGEMLESALKHAGVDVSRKVYTGVTHEFFGMAAAISKAKTLKTLRVRR